MQIILGVVYGVLFVILLGFGAFVVVMGLRLVSAINGFSGQLIVSADNLQSELESMRGVMKDAKDESEKLRNSLLPFSEAMNRTSAALLEVTKGFDRFDLMRTALARNSEVGKEVVKISDIMIKQLRSTAEVGALICQTVLRGATVRSTNDAGIAAEVSIGGPPENPNIIPPGDESSFSGMTEAEAAFNENVQKAKAQGVVVDEPTDRKVPLDRMNKAGES